MKFYPTPLHTAAIIELESRSDDRGFFARLFCEDELAAAGLVCSFPQVNNSMSIHVGTIRGLHYQLPPADEAKIMRCVRGAIFDAIVDLRPDSPTFGQSYGKELTPDNRLMMYVPKGFAHGYLSLQPNSEVIYWASERYSPGQERGIRFNDPKLNIGWPITPTFMSDKDRLWADFDPNAPELTAFDGVALPPPRA